ncbi:MAG: M28 family peptidase [Chitinophagaceae bacterium]|mgnify:CR=1 FL=1|nr:M28 family peptidase [Chitinophagaceae bacterium]
MKSKFLILSFLIPCFVNAQSDFGPKEEADYRNFASTLASDSFMGRKPFTKGEDITTNYIRDEFQSMGLKPGNHDSYFQNVPMVEIKGRFKDDKVTLTGKNGSIDLEPMTEVVGGTRRVVAEQKIENAPLVFVGFGIDAPEYHWNDFAGIDVKGKILIVMVNDPGFYNPKLFRGKNMTYYGRWTYKFEEAARKGAAGVLIIHDTKPASYGWGVVKSSWGSSKLFLQTANGNMNFCALEGWISGDATSKLFELAGIKNASALIERAKHPGFKAVSIPLKLSATIINQIKKSNSKNVVGLLPGTSRKNEYLIFSAHWDHFGVGEPINGDSIYNGAADNASGVAGMMTLAKKFKEGKPNERSILFIALTGEEAGLLGSEYYATHPIYPLKKTVADINFDVLQPFGKMKDIFLIGKGQSAIDNYLEAEAKKEGRIVRSVPDPSNGWYYRSDHFNFAKVGIPTLYTGTGVESVEHGEVWGKAQEADYNTNRYHKPQDNYYPSWDVSGTMADLNLIYETARKLANTNDFPKWDEGTMYKKIRDAQK